MHTLLLCVHSYENCFCTGEERKEKELENLRKRQGRTTEFSRRYMYCEWRTATIDNARNHIVKYSRNRS